MDKKLKVNGIYVGDVREVAKTLPDRSVHCMVTSPPYFGLRDYGTAEWEGGDPACDHSPRRRNPTNGSTLGGGKRTTGHAQEPYKDICLKCGAICVDRQVGLEETPEQYVDTLVGIFRELRRVLRDDGSLWLNLGDSYAANRPDGQPVPTNTGNKNGHYGVTKAPPNLKPKDLIGIPWRVALALQADGWYLRSAIIWHKPNCMPESVKDRPTSSYEFIFLLAKSARYYYDGEAIKEPSSENSHGGGIAHNGRYMAQSGRCDGDRAMGILTEVRNKRDVWTIPTKPYQEAHFAVFPPDLIRPCILAGTSAKGACPECGAPWERIVEKSVSFESGSGKAGNKPNGKYNGAAQSESGDYDIRMGPVVQSNTVGWRPTCKHYNPLYLEDFPRARNPRKRRQREASGDWWRRVRQRPGLSNWPVVPCVVLDPFVGSGTTIQVAIEEGRQGVGIELNADYVEMARRRLHGTQLTIPDC